MLSISIIALQRQFIRLSAAMAPFWAEQFGNPSSHHRIGYQAARAAEKARRTVAEVLGTDPETIVFTGCGSESNNLALRGR